MVSTKSQSSDLVLAVFALYGRLEKVNAIPVGDFDEKLYMGLVSKDYKEREYIDEQKWERTLSVH